MEKVLLGMSGGVDSSAAAKILQNMGFEVIGATMQLIKKEEDINVIDAKKVCDKLKIKHVILNYYDDFEKYVINNFINEYKNGRTPNPCICCNKYMKFGKFLEAADELGAKYIATGHYAKVEFDNNLNKYLLKKATSDKKDQSYVLYNLNQEILSRTLFPLSNFENKEEIRNIAKEIGVNIEGKKDSQEICFVPDDDYVSYIDNRLHILKEGNIVNSKGEILGKHNGTIKYTIGQRRGLGISNRVPLFVVGIDIKKNEVIVGEENELYNTELEAENVNYIFYDEVKDPFKCMAKIRYAAKLVKCTVYPKNKNQIKVIFDEAQKSITPGQSIVLYDEENVIGGGIITTF